MNPNKIEPRALDILEEEGLGAAINSVCRVLRGEGLTKHGTRRWSSKRYREHFRKAIRHLSTEGADDGSGEPHTANGVARSLMMLALELKK